MTGKPGRREEGRRGDGRRRTTVATCAVVVCALAARAADARSVTPNAEANDPNALREREGSVGGSGGASRIGRMFRRGGGNEATDVGSAAAVFDAARTASLGFSLADVEPRVVDEALPHGAGSWPWKFGGLEGKKFTCMPYPYTSPPPPPGAPPQPAMPPAPTLTTTNPTTTTTNPTTTTANPTTNPTTANPTTNPTTANPTTTTTTNPTTTTTANPTTTTTPQLGQDPTATVVDETRVIIRFGTYGSKDDTGTDKYDSDWFNDPANARDIQWTYSECKPWTTVYCGPSSFGFVDPFPSIEAGQPGKRCQFIDASEIPADHMNMTIPFTAAEDRVFDDTSLNVNVEFAVEKASGGRVFRNFMLLSADFVKELIEDTFQGTKLFRSFDWKWCANEGKGRKHLCECNTIMRYGWTGNATLKAPKHKVEPDFTQWTYVDMRSEQDLLMPCNADKLGKVRPFPSRGDDTRICQCLSNETLATYNAGFQAVIGGDDVPGQQTHNLTVSEQIKEFLSSSKKHTKDLDKKSEKKNEADLGRHSTHTAHKESAAKEKDAPTAAATLATATFNAERDYSVEDDALIEGQEGEDFAQMRLEATETINGDMGEMFSRIGLCAIGAAVVVFAVTIARKVARSREYERVPEHVEDVGV